MLKAGTRSILKHSKSHPLQKLGPDGKLSKKYRPGMAQARKEWAKYIWANKAKLKARFASKPA